jgi:insulin receptor substrate 1
LKTCFNINKRIDIKQKWVIALYTKKDCFCIDFDNEDEMDSWLRGLIELQLGEDIPDGTPIKPTFGKFTI